MRTPKNRRIADYCLFLVLLMLTAQSIAGSTEASEQVLSAYPNAVIERHQDERRVNYRLVSSNLKKVNNVIKADVETWKNGQLLRTIYRLPEGHSSFAAFDFFMEQFNNKQVKPVFQCDRFSCGESSYWANDVFNEPRLFGLNKEQNYYIGKAIENNQPVYYALYTVRRGNQRVYALVDQFYPDRKPGTSSSVKTSYPMVQDEAFETVTELHQIIKDKWRQIGHRQLVIYLGSKTLPTIGEHDRTTETLTTYKKTLKASLASDGMHEKQYRIYTIQDALKPDFPIKNYFVRMVTL